MSKQQLDNLIRLSAIKGVVSCKYRDQVLFRFYDPNKGRKCSSCDCITHCGTLNTQTH